MNIQVAYVDFVMNRQQRLAFAQTVVYVYDIFFLNKCITQHSTDCVIIPIPGFKT